MKLSNTIIKTITVATLCGAVLTGCKKNFFDLPDQNGIDSRIWDDAGAVGQFLDRGYDLMMPSWPSPGTIHYTSDELNNANTTFLYGQLTDNSVTDIATSSSITANRYFDIRRCNIGIDGINSGSLDDATKKKLKGQLFFLRAQTYFNLVRLYGGVPLVMHAQVLDTDDLNVPRSKTSVCIDSIVRDLDSATAYLPTSWPAADRGRITQAAALCLKGKVLMYWASPQFNPTNIATRWENAYKACRAAYDSCIAQGFALYPTYANIFIDESNTNKESIIIRVYDATSVSPGRGTNTEYITRPRSETTALAGGGSNQPTLNLVKAYTMKDGVPINKSTDYDATLFWQNRDPRFAATIAYNGCTWPLSGNTSRKQWCYTGVLDEGSALTTTGFYCRRICNPAINAAQTQYNSNSGGGSGMDWIEMRLAEVIMNVAECANETGRLSEAKDMVRLIRVRAGITAGAQDYGLSLAPDQTAMRDLIMNERMVEFAMEGKRYHDLRRTRRLHLLTGTTRNGIKWVAKDPYVAGKPPTNPSASKIYLDSVYVSGIRPRDTANLNNLSVYTKMFTPSEVSLDATQAINIPELYYFYPLNTFFRQSSYKIEQTIGWPGGSFDPLQ